MSAVRYLYVATETTSDNYTSLAHILKEPKGKRLFGGLIEGKPYQCYTDDKGRLWVGGFFNMEEEVEVKRKKKPSTFKLQPMGKGFFVLEFEKATAAKFLKFKERILYKSTIKK